MNCTSEWIVIVLTFPFYHKDGFSAQFLTQYLFNILDLGVRPANGNQHGIAALSAFCLDWAVYARLTVESPAAGEFGLGL